MFNELIVTKKYLNEHPQAIFVFGDNLTRRGTGGAALLRYEPNTYGFITKKYPSNDDHSFFQPREYKKIFEKELANLIAAVHAHPEFVYLISKLGSGLANKYQIWEKIIQPGLQELKSHKNVQFLFED